MPAKNFSRHFVLIATAILAITGWLLDIIGISIQQDKRWKGQYEGKNPISVYWFFTWFYFFTVVGFLIAVFKSAIDAYRLLLIALFSIAFVFAVNDTETNLSLARSDYDPSNGAAVQCAGTIILAITFLTWIITLGSAANSGLAKATDLTLPTTRPGRTNPETAQQPAMTQKNKEAAPAQQNVAARHPAYADAPATTGTTTTTTTVVPPPPAHNNETVAEREIDGATTKVITMFSYDANPDDPQEMSFQKNEVLEILDNRGQWWTARRTAGDGTVQTGLVPRNYLTPIA